MEKQKEKPSSERQSFVHRQGDGGRKPATPWMGVDAKVSVWVRSIGALAAIATFCAVIFTVVLSNKELANKELAYMVIGQLSSTVLGIYNFWFGSSEGSRRKDEKKDHDPQWNNLSKPSPTPFRHS